MRKRIAIDTMQRVAAFGWRRFAATLLLLPSLAAVAAERSALEEVVVTATRIPVAWDRSPLAVGEVGRERVQAARQQLALDEALAVVPGVFFQNRYNFAQDLRIAIRGFGARANFGIRGIRLVADGIPLTMPDGQGNVDSIDLGSVERIEVIRGPVSAMYGAAGGGAILLYGEEPPESPFASARLAGGAYGYRDAQVRAGGRGHGWGGLASLGRTELDGYRDNARYERTLLNSRARTDLGAGSTLTVVFNAVDSPVAQDPGALTAAEMAADPRQAAPRNLQFHADESLEQQKLGLVLNRSLTGGQAALLSAYAIRRDFRNRLPFDVNSNGQGGSVDLDRDVRGVGGHWSRDDALPGGRSLRLVVGFDYEQQRDLRRRYANDSGVIGALTTAQDEDVTARGLFAEGAVDLARRWRLTLGARYDAMRYRVQDRTGRGGSGTTSVHEFSPMAGLVWSAGRAASVYANVSTGFDPPAITELANPEGPTGFNRALGPQQATNYELGVKGVSADRLRYEAAVFHIDVRDEIVPYELGGSGQAFYRNAGSSTHEGVEAALQVGLLPGLQATVTYTWSDFRFDRFRDETGTAFDGNRIPGVPRHLFHLALDWHPDTERGAYAGLDVLYAGRFYADDANAVPAGDYAVADLRAGWRWSGARWSIEPFAGIGNLFDERYSGNVRINASFGRYWEPAPGRNAYAGVALRAAF